MKKIIIAFLMIFIMGGQSFAFAADRSAERRTLQEEPRQEEKMEIIPSDQNYVLALLPIVDRSNMEEKERKVAMKAIKAAIEKKYPKKNTKVKVISDKEITKAMRMYLFENYDAPVLAELVTIGKAVHADRIIYLSLEPIKSEEDGFRIIIGAQKFSSEIGMKMKFIDVNENKYLFNQFVVKEGSSSAVSFWKLGGASKSRSVKKAVTECMKEFFTNID
ncbi:MAG TPA: hypothetical protein IAB06_00265 [Candidatus Avacidaminococcus intestinavium]|uniref:Lipoprotein n=1 Tax=Candidatus Avacidaminococcus intestinavium TaxID=2840684 RepID=A0A9D1MMU9_9FIRM|nr:hypothetical protein [Candidatus Avacidaminococcus intestinavium]